MRPGTSLDNNRLVVSSIDGWFSEDFGGSAGVLDHLRQDAAPELRQKPKPEIAVDGHADDWSLKRAALTQQQQVAGDGG